MPSVRLSSLLILTTTQAKGNTCYFIWDLFQFIANLYNDMLQNPLKSECDCPCGEVIITRPHTQTSHPLDLDWSGLAIWMILRDQPRFAATFFPLLPNLFFFPRYGSVPMVRVELSNLSLNPLKTKLNQQTLCLRPSHIAVCRIIYGPDLMLKIIFNDVSRM